MWSCHLRPIVSSECWLHSAQCVHFVLPFFPLPIFFISAFWVYHSTAILTLYNFLSNQPVLSTWWRSFNQMSRSLSQPENVLFWQKHTITPRRLVPPSTPLFHSCRKEGTIPITSSFLFLSFPPFLSFFLSVCKTNEKAHLCDDDRTECVM